jgi:hypothetical protein
VGERAGDAADDRRGDAAVAVGGDHDQVGVDLVRCVRDELRDVLRARADHEPRVDPAGAQLLDLLRDLLLQLGLVREDRSSSRPARQKLVGMDRDDLRAVKPG